MNGQQSSQDPAVRVLVVDDQQLMREGLASLLRVQDGIEIAGTAANGQEAIDQARALQPDVILLDVRMPVMDGVQAAELLHREFPDCKILMLTTFDDEEYVLRSLSVGASGYLLKDMPARDLAQAVHAVRRGIYQFDPAVMNRVMTALAESTRSTLPSPALPIPTPTLPKHAGLTGREIEVLRLVARGATNREIADALVVSEGTVKNHLSNILSRLGLRDRTQAAIYAHDHDLL
jgi:DNA-binding NarL/FixJ family response regulator